MGSKYIMTMDPSAGFPNKRFGSGVSNRKTLSQELLAGMLSEGPQVEMVELKSFIGRC